MMTTPYFFKIDASKIRKMTRDDHKYEIEFNNGDIATYTLEVGNAFKIMIKLFVNNVSFDHFTCTNAEATEIAGKFWQDTLGQLYFETCEKHLEIKRRETKMAIQSMFVDVPNHMKP